MLPAGKWQVMNGSGRPMMETAVAAVKNVRGWMAGGAWTLPQPGAPAGGLILLGGNDGRGREMIYSGTAAGGSKVRGRGSIAGATYS